MSFCQRRLGHALETCIFPIAGLLQPSWAWEWWSQTGSNRRPHACKARALPTELWPLSEASQRELSVIRPIRPRIHRNVVGPGGLEPPTSRLSGVCSNQLSYRPLKRHVPTTRSSLTRRGTRDRTTACIRGCGVLRKEKRRRRRSAPDILLNEPISRSLEVHP